VLHIRARPNDLKAELPSGELWVDSEEGSVLMIQLDPHAVTGFLNRSNLIKKNRRTAAITDTHHYFKLFKDIRFPTSTLIQEKQTHNEKIPFTPMLKHYAVYRQPTVYSVEFQYQKYQFFDVQSDERITGWVED